MDMSKVFKSSLGIKYPTFRDYPLHSGEKWLEGKNNDDGAEGLWRIHDNLYDLNGFIEIHPGGRDWIELTKGTDITEAFEVHHLTDNAETLLPKFFIKKATSPRSFPFTFHEKDFYKTLKRRIIGKLETLPKHLAIKSHIMTDALFASYVGLFLLAVYFKSFVLGIGAGLCLGLVTVAAHNYFHQKDNFRRFYFDFSLMSSKEWRISHVLSHHMYTNTISDMEIAAVEPFLQYLPGEKNLLVRYGSWLYSPAIYAFLFFGFFVKTLLQNYLKSKVTAWPTLLPFTIPVLAWLLTGQPVMFCFGMFLWIVIMGSIHFGIVGLNAAHHHPDIFHDGDATRPKSEMDWGLFQLDAVMDRKDITGSHFLVLTNFGDHALHHLFPTIDHGYLEHLYPVFLETCAEFQADWRLVSQLDLIKGQFKQLAKVLPNRNVPK
ncbi:unnamed protein product [Ceutorhynchus assimilis]|uniref:Cytochrome b5-related protein n=1 Tax=Ceutorhynchus assimilis TaxID=467358 RepID=A0A9N9MZH9_9CUCU|nr:unnamed protein product [Ceutorhynchus assimilis]